MASHLALSSRPSSAFTAAAAFLTSVSAYTTASGMRSPEMRKKRRLRSVCAPQSRSASTSIGPKLSFSMRVPDMPALCYGSRLPLFLLRLRRRLGMYLRHVERLRLSNYLLERRAGKRPGLLEQDHFLAEHDQRRNRADAEGAGELLLLVGVHLGEDDVRMRLRCLLVDGREAFARPAPRCPEVDQHHRVVIDGLLEVFLGQFDDSHGAPFKKVRQCTLDRHVHRPVRAIAVGAAAHGIADCCARQLARRARRAWTVARAHRRPRSTALCARGGPCDPARARAPGS